MEIDWQEVAKSLSTRIGASALETDQWKHIAEKLYRENADLKSKIQVLESSAEESPANSAKESADG